MNLVRLPGVMLATGLIIAAGPCAASPAGGYIGLSAGRSRIDVNAATLGDDLAAAGAGPVASGALDRNDTGFKLRYGYDAGMGWAVEAGYIDFGRARYSGRTAAGGADGRVRARGVNFDVLRKLAVGRNTALYGKAGILYASVKTDASAPGVGISHTAHRFAPGLGAGVAYDLTPQVALRAEWERYFRLGDGRTGRGDADLVSVGVDFRY